jgi:hypothetical protein
MTFAQDGETPEKRSYGKVSLEFINRSVYLGRMDSVTTAYLTPSIGYYDKSGVFVSGAASYLAHSGENRFDIFNIDAGYEFSIGNFNGEITAEKSFYSSNSTNVRSEVKGNLTAQASYDFGFIESSLQPGINFGNKNDYFLEWKVDHDFTAVANKLIITPSFLLNATTRNFYGSYYGKRKLKKKNGPGLAGSVSVKDASKLKLMNYELSLPFYYTIRNFSIGFAPSYSIASNPALITIITKPASGPPVTNTITEKIKNLFYFSFEAAIKF